MKTKSAGSPCSSKLLLVKCLISLMFYSYFAVQHNTCGCHYVHRLKIVQLSICWLPKLKHSCWHNIAENRLRVCGMVLNAKYFELLDFVRFLPFGTKIVDSKSQHCSRNRSSEEHKKYNMKQTTNSSIMFSLDLSIHDILFYFTHISILHTLYSCG